MTGTYGRENCLRIEGRLVAIELKMAQVRANAEGCDDIPRMKTLLGLLAELQFEHAQLVSILGGAAELE